MNETTLQRLADGIQKVAKNLNDEMDTNTLDINTEDTETIETILIHKLMGKVIHD